MQTKVLSSKFCGCSCFFVVKKVPECLAEEFLLVPRVHGCAPLVAAELVVRSARLFQMTPWRFQPGCKGGGDSSVIHPLKESTAGGFSIRNIPSGTDFRRGAKRSIPELVERQLPMLDFNGRNCICGARPAQRKIRSGSGSQCTLSSLLPPSQDKLLKRSLQQLHSGGVKVKMLACTSLPLEDRNPGGLLVVLCG